MSRPAVQVFVLRTRHPIATRATIARSFLERMVGLLGRQGLQEGEALIFPGCRSIHMWGMRFAIDAIFVDRAWRVVVLRPRLAPWRLVLPVPGAWGVVEAPAGSVERTGLVVGDTLQLVEEAPSGTSTAAGGSSMGVAPEQARKKLTIQSGLRYTLDARVFLDNRCSARPFEKGKLTVTWGRKASDLCSSERRVGSWAQGIGDSRAAE